MCADMPLQKEVRGDNIKVRVQPSAKFAVDFAARVLRKSVSQLVTDGVMPIAETTTFRGKSWKDYDDPTPGYSFCKMCLDGLPMSKEEDDLKRFILSHKEFFFDGEEPARRRLDVLWPKVPHYAETYFRKMRTDNQAAGHEMNRALVEAKRKPIKWPPEDER
jgi:hypothetical protein